MFENPNKDPGPAEIRKFANTLLVGLPVAGLVWTGIVWWGKDVFTPWVLVGFAATGVFVFLLSLVSRAAGRRAFILWHGLAAMLEAIIRLAAVFVMYYLTLAPIGILMRLWGRQPLGAAFDRTRKSYWKDCKKPPDLKRYFRQF